MVGTNLKNRSKSKKIDLILHYIILAIFAVFFIFPTIFMFVTSIKNDESQIVSDISNIKGFIPYGDIGFQNYIDIFQRMPVGKFFFNSLLIVTITILLGLFVNSMIAFALARLDFKGKKILLGIIIALMIIPIESVVIPMLLMVNKFGLVNTYVVQIIPFIADPLYIFLFYQFFIGLPKSLDEAAVIDGASFFRIYLQITLPLSKPVIASVAILASIQRWGEFLWPLMTTRGETYRPLPVAMQQFFSQDPKMWGDIFAFASVITLPILILFLVFQKQFIKSVASSGIKG